MINKNEMQLRLLAELEEAHWNNVFSLLNTVIVPSGDLSEPGVMQDAVLAMVAEGKLLIGTEAFYPRKAELLSSEAAVEFASRLAEQFEFNARESYWTYVGGSMRTGRYPFVELTAEGLKAAEAILGQRGYRWWEHGN
jgi:hypothetical protein